MQCTSSKFLLVRRYLTHGGKFSSVVDVYSPSYRGYSATSEERQNRRSKILGLLRPFLDDPQPEQIVLVAQGSEQELVDDCNMVAMSTKQ